MPRTRPKIKFLAFAATSIDGIIARNSRSGTDWTSKEDWKFFQRSLAQMDAVIAGRNTYEVYKNKLDRRNTIVLTSKVARIRIHGSVVFFNPAKSNIKKFLAAAGYRRIGIVGGARVYAYCLSAGLLDELFLTIEPYVFTRGVPLFYGKNFKKYKFKLLSVKKLNKEGTLLLKYQYGN